METESKYQFSKPGLETGEPGKKYISLYPRDRKTITFFDMCNESLYNKTLDCFRIFCVSTYTENGFSLLIRVVEPNRGQRVVIPRLSV